MKPATYQSGVNASFFGLSLLSVYGGHQQMNLGDKSGEKTEWEKSLELIADVQETDGGDSD